MRTLVGKFRRPSRSGAALSADRRGLLTVLGAGSLVLATVVSPASAAYKVQQGDTIEIAVAGIPELRQRSTVQPDGAIALPLTGALAVEGLTPAELRAEVQTQLGRKIYRLRGNDGREILTVIQPEEVSAAIVAYRPIYVTGDVAKPGEQVFWPEMTIRQALALAGGAEFPQARLSRSSRNLSELTGDYELALIGLARATARGARLTAELGGQNDLASLDFSDVPLPKEKLAEIQRSEAAILQARMAAYQRERDFLKAAIDQADDRIAVVQRQQAEEEEGSRADTAELRRLIDLLNKGQETNPRITDARRALLFSSTRALEVNVELLELKRQKMESARQAQHFEDDRRVALLKELQDAATMKAEARIKIRTVESDLAALSRAPLANGAEQDAEQTIEVVRQGKGNSTKSIVDEDFVLMPGDVVEVSLRTQERSADSER
jgi:polysaccharide export outer membrane protein